MAERPIEELARAVLAQERAAVTAALRDVVAAYEQPLPDGPRARDLTWLAGRPHEEELSGVLTLAVHDAAEVLRATREHVLALEAVLAAKDMLPIPALTLARAVHESVIYICWLADPDLLPAQRVARAAAMTLAASQGGHEALPTFPGQTDAESRRVREGFTGIQGLLEGYGLIINRRDGTDYASSVVYEGHKAALRINVTEASRRYIPGNHHMWVTGSGAAHSRGWFTRGLEGPWSELVVMVVGPLLDVVDALIDNTHGYVGLDTAPIHTRTHLRRRALLDRVRPSNLVAGYETYAAHRNHPGP